VRKPASWIAPFVVGCLSVLVTVVVPWLLRVSLEPALEGGVARYGPVTLLVGLLVALAPLGAIIGWPLALARRVRRWVDSPRRSRRHRAWLLPGAAGVVSLVAGWGMAWLLERAGRSADPRFWLGLESIAAAYLGTGLALGLLIAVIAPAHRAFRYWRRSRGRFNKAEQAAAALHQSAVALQGAATQAWNYAVAVRRDLLAGAGLPPYRVWDVVARPGESFVFDDRAGYARYYGTDVAYTQRSGFYFGSPAFVLAGLAIDAAANNSARNRAVALAREQWRDWQTVRVVVSDQRFLVQVGPQWLTFDYSVIAAIYPDLASASLVVQFTTGAAPLLLRGPASWLGSIMALAAVFGPPALREHPYFIGFEQPALGALPVAGGLVPTANPVAAPAPGLAQVEVRR
jgi:hypothetical protein